jgi:hypothetical protein
LKQRILCSQLDFVLNFKSGRENFIVFLYILKTLTNHTHSPTNPHWARVVGYGPFSLCLIHKEGFCSSSGDINRLMMSDSQGRIECSGLNSRLLRKGSQVRSPHRTNICVQEHVCLYQVFSLFIAECCGKSMELISFMKNS